MAELTQGGFFAPPSVQYRVCSDPVQNRAQENLNTDIKTLKQWLDANKLSPNLVKTECMIIASSPKLKNVDFRPFIKLAGKPIKLVLKTDYLGLIIDQKLSWVDYVLTLTKKISSAVAAIKKADFLPRIYSNHSLSKSSRIMA